jgi:putative ABC transport system substrate-binding protein
MCRLARPGGNATGLNWFGLEVTSKLLELLHELVPRAVRIAVLVNPGNAQAIEATLKGVREAANALDPKFWSATPAPVARSTQPLRHLGANALRPCS